MARSSWMLCAALVACMAWAGVDAHGFISAPVSRNLLANTNCNLLPGKTCNYEPQSLAAGGPGAVGANGNDSLRMSRARHLTCSFCCVMK
jgi:hypothetical protein